MNKTKHLFLTLLFALLTISVHAQSSFNYTANGRVWKCVGSSDGTASIIGIAEPASTCSGVLNFPGEVIDGNGQHRPVTWVGSIIGGFNGYSLITDVNIPLSVKWISNSAFSGCTGLTTVSMPSVENIDDYAFYRCTNLTNVNMAPKRVGDRAFEDCSHLSSAINLTNAKILGVSAFQNTGITSVTFGHDLKKISNSAFSGTPITSLTIPAEVTEIGPNAFNNCTSLTSINFEEGPTPGVAKIGEYAFFGCTSITSLTIPGKFKTIERNGFGGCSSLTQLHLQSGLEDIGQNAFYNCSLTGDLTIPETMKSIREDAFANCPFGGTLIMKAQRQPAWDGYNSNHNSVFVGKNSLKFSHIVLDGPEPSALIAPEGMGFSGIKSLLGNSIISSLTIRPSVKKLPAFALYNANLSNISSFNIPATVEEINAYAFCKVKFPPSTHLTIPSTVTKVGYDAFSESNITEFTIEAGGITEIPKEICINCSNLSRVNLPEGITKIGETAFYNTVSLTDVNFPMSLIEIGKDAFGKCTSLTNILLPEGLKSVALRAFADCSSLTNITPLPSTITRIEDQAFANCPLQGDANEMIPSSLQYIGKEVFNSTGITGEAVFSHLKAPAEGDYNITPGNPFLKSRVYGIRMGTYDKYFNGRGGEVYTMIGQWDYFSGLLYIDTRDCTIQTVHPKGEPNTAYKFSRENGYDADTYPNFVSASVNTLVYLPSEVKFNDSALPTATFDQRFNTDENNDETGGDGSNFIMDGKCKQFFVKDGLPYRVPFAFTAQTARYSRTFNVTTGKAVSTLYLPYPTDLPEGMCAYTLVKKNVHSDGEKTFVFREVPQGTRLSANKPYLVRITDGQTHKLPVMHNVAVPVSPSVDAAGQIGIEDSDWKFFGTTEKIDNAAAYAKKAYYLNDNKWWAVQNGVENDYIAPFRCFISSPTGAAASRSFLLVLEGDDDSNVTGINQLESDTEKDMHSGKYPFYSIDGKLMGKDYNKLERGQIYIVNGKKFYKF